MFDDFTWHNYYKLVNPTSITTGMEYFTYSSETKIQGDPISLSQGHVFFESDWWDQNAIETSERGGGFVQIYLQIMQIQSYC